MMVGFDTYQETYDSERQAYLVTIQCLGHRRPCDEGVCRPILDEASKYYEGLLLSGNIVDKQ
jgi:hypothetical protein